MLIDFTYSNFKCFRDVQQFSMRRGTGDLNLQPAGWPYGDVSSVAAIYGGNAAGKSSVLEALTYLSGIVAKDARAMERDGGFNRPPFLLDQRSGAMPTDFYVDFIGVDEREYIYQVSIDDRRVLYEGLRVYTGKRTSNVFERELNSDDVGYSFSYGRSFVGAKKAFEKMSRGGVLFLSTLHDANYDVTEPAYEVLANRIKSFPAWEFDREFGDIIAALDESSVHASALSSIMARSNLGIRSVKVESRIARLLREMSSREHPAYEGLKSILGAVVEEFDPDLDDEVRSAMLEEMLDVRAKQTGDYKNLAFSHRAKDGEAILSLDQESRGTKSSLAFFSVALRVLTDRSICIVDELDMSLHPKYVRELVRLFRDPKTNPCQSQLIFTSHDTTLMTASVAEDPVLDRDQIWFVEKDFESGAAELFPLTALHVRRGENYERNYLNGVYGAIPDPRFHDAFAAAIADLRREG